MAWLVQLGAVALGGAIGASARWGLASAIEGATLSRYPLGTLTVNVLGCLAIGLLAAWFASQGEHDAPGRYAVRMTEHHHLLIMVGVLGGFTTFSTFALDALALSAQGERTVALVYILLSNTLGIAAAIAGWWLGERLFVA